MGKIINKLNGLMLIILILGLIFLVVGAVSGFQKICSHYGSTPKYDTMFSSYQCKDNFKPLTCNKLKADMSKCNGFEINKTKI